MEQMSMGAGAEAGTRLVLLGASNLTMGLPFVLGMVRREPCQAEALAEPDRRVRALLAEAIRLLDDGRTS